MEFQSNMAHTVGQSIGQVEFMNRLFREYIQDQLVN